MLVSWVLHLRLCHMTPVKAKSIFQEMWFFCTIWHKVPLMCISNFAPTAYSFEANYQLIWEPILCHLHIESTTVLYASLAEKAHHFHGAFALSVRFLVKVFSITMCLQFIALTEFDPQGNSYVCVSLLTHCGQISWTKTHATSSLILQLCHMTCTFSSAIHFQQTEEHFLLAVCRCLHAYLICETKLKL
jgi:hypothetical protein